MEFIIVILGAGIGPGIMAIVLQYLPHELVGNYFEAV